MNFYEFFGVQYDAGEEELKSAYRKMCNKHHPDKHQIPENKEKAEVNFKVVQYVWDVLRSPPNRRKYDEQNGFRQPEQRPEIVVRWFRSDGDINVEPGEFFF